MNTSLYGGLIEISPDGQPIAPDLVLAYRGGTKQGIIHNVQSLTNKNDLAQAAESFSGGRAAPATWHASRRHGP